MKHICGSRCSNHSSLTVTVSVAVMLSQVQFLRGILLHPVFEIPNPHLTAQKLDCFLYKPFDLKTLQAVIGRFLEERCSALFFRRESVLIPRRYCCCY